MNLYINVCLLGVCVYICIYTVYICLTNARQNHFSVLDPSARHFGWMGFMLHFILHVLISVNTHLCFELLELQESWTLVA